MTAVNSLGNDTTIVIKQADKGGATVIMDALSNRKYYMPINSNPEPRLHQIISAAVFSAESQEWISKKEAEFLVKKDPKTPYFYILPKIHKETRPVPGRPIVSGIDSILEPLSQFCDHFLQPMVKQTPSYIQDTTDMLRLISEFPTTSGIDLLVTLDVEALYTNIPQRTTLGVIEEVINRVHWESNTPRSFVVEMATIVLTENFLEFQGQLYKQVQGTYMGSTMAPSAACLYMADFEEKYILAESNPYQVNLCLWKRFIDDIIIFWKGDANTCKMFCDWVNTLNPFLRFTSSISSQQIPFLDLLIKLNNGTLSTTVYRKPTDRNSLLLFSSCHPRALKENLPIGQAFEASPQL